MTKTIKKNTRRNENKNGIKILESDVSEEDFNFSKSKRIKEFTPKNKKQREIYESFEINPVTFILGDVGTGKTYLPVHYATSKLLEKKYNKIVVLRATVTAYEQIGFLKGDLEEKVKPYLESMLIPMRELVGDNTVKDLINREIIKLDAIGFQRGITYKNTIILVDELQNLIPEQLRLVLTRIDDSSKVILMGDRTQCDLDDKSKSAILDLDRFKNNNNIGFHVFNKNEVVRGKITQVIHNCYPEYKNELSDWEYYYGEKEVYTTDKY